MSDTKSGAEFLEEIRQETIDAGYPDPDLDLGNFSWMVR